MPSTEYESVVSIPRHGLHLRYQLGSPGMFLNPRYELWESPGNLRESMARHGASHPGHMGGTAKR